MYVRSYVKRFSKLSDLNENGNDAMVFRKISLCQILLKSVFSPSSLMRTVDRDHAHVTTEMHELTLLIPITHHGC